MLAAHVVTLVERLLAEGRLSQRKIARVARVSRASVGQIAAGRRPDYESQRRARAAEETQSDGPPARCPGCGGLVYGPCRACRLRRQLAAQSLVLRLCPPGSRQGGPTLARVSG